MERVYQPRLPDLAFVVQSVVDMPHFLSAPLPQEVMLAERACLDRYLRILDALERRGLFGCSLLDIGCANGYFSYLFSISLCRQVTAVDDARGAFAGYSENAFLEPLRKVKREYALGHLEIVESPIEKFLPSCLERQWDAVLCLSVLHHFYTGYGDHPERGQLADEERRSLFRSIGRATGSVLYLEIDHGRTPDGFLSEFTELGGFKGCNVIGSSCSAVGETRTIFEVWK